MSNEEITRFWGEDSLVRWPPELLAQTELPEDARNFLAHVGLPRGANWTTRFDLTMEDMRRSLSNSRFLIVGYDDEVPISLDLQRHGRVVSTEPGLGERFVNTDVTRFAECLVLYQRYRLAVRGLFQEKDVRGLVSETEQAIRISDAAALSDPENWWAVVIEQMRAGLL